ncbi:MAG: RhoGAP domain-containing protein [Enterovibrio sp.]
MTTTPPSSPKSPTRATSAVSAGGAGEQSQDQNASSLPVTGTGNTGDTPQTTGTTSANAGLGRRNAVRKPAASGQPQTAGEAGAAGAVGADDTEAGATSPSPSPPIVAPKPEASQVVAALAGVPPPSVDRSVKPPKTGSGQQQGTTPSTDTPPPSVDRSVKPPPARPPKTFLAAAAAPPYPTVERNAEQQAAVKGIEKIFTMLRTDPEEAFHPFMQKEGVFRLSAEKKAFDKFIDKVKKDKDKKAAKAEPPTLKELFQQFMSLVKGTAAGATSKKAETKDPVLLAAALKSFTLTALLPEEKKWFGEQAQKHAAAQSPAPLPPLSVLPPFLQNILELCAYVALNSDVTKMTASNLGVCLGPNLAPELEVGTAPAAAMAQAVALNADLVKLCEDYINQIVQANTIP